MTTAKSRFTASAVEVRSSFARANRSSSRRVRTNARITRIPASVSRPTRFRPSIRPCIRRKSGSARLSESPTTAPMSGTMTTRSPDRGTSWRSAMITPPIAVSGAETRTVRPMRTTIWTCWTSFVFRVMRDGAPKRATSRCEKVWTEAKIAPRRSRPKPIAIRAAQ